MQSLESLVYASTQKEVIIPSGDTITIREVNGEDESILSNNSLINSGSNIIKFLSQIIVGINGQEKRVTEDILKTWPINDKYYLLLASRIFSYGKDLKFTNICSNCGTSNKYKEDLELFDYSSPEGTENPSARSSFNIKPYPTKSKEIHLNLSSGKTVKYNKLDSTGELDKLAIPEIARNINSEFIIRGLKLLNGNEYFEVKHFAIFGPKDLLELRTSLNREDAIFSPLTEVVCPHCNNKEYHSILTISDFFYPTEM